MTTAPATAPRPIAVPPPATAPRPVVAPAPVVASGSVHPAGWYADPSGAGVQRYWDGAAWTSHVHPTVPAPGRGAAVTVSAALVADAAPRRESIAATALGVAIAVSSLLPWLSVHGTDVGLGDLSGTAVVVLMAAGGFLAWYGWQAHRTGRVRWSGFACAAVVAAIGVFGMYTPDSEESAMAAVEFGMGSLVACSAGLASIWTLVVLWRHQAKISKIESVVAA